MKVASNKINDIKLFIRDQLKELYPVEEIDSFFYILMETYCDMSRPEVLALSRETINESELLLLYDAVLELTTGKPIQYITGTTDFYGIRLKVNPEVLIPRPETEELVDLIIRNHIDKTGLRILDIGTGSGCIAIALKQHMADASVLGIDISAGALQTARHNARDHQSDVSFMMTDILDKNVWPALPQCDLIVSNPPYVTESEKILMHENVLDHEPHIALFVKDHDPLLYYRAIFDFITFRNHLCNLYVEINENKAEDLIFYANESGFSDICVHKDSRGKNRMLSAVCCHPVY